jgi:hypothetical protein
MRSRKGNATMTTETHLGGQLAEHLDDQHSGGGGQPLGAAERIPVRVYRHSAEANRAVA